MGKINPSEHFDSKPENTKIKHDIFEKTFEKSLAIANHFARSSQSFIFSDLFAGQGKFEDGSRGSPLIAYEIINKLCMTNKLKFKDCNMLLIDKDAIKLKQNFDTLNSDKINVTIHQGDWGAYKPDIQKELSKSTWGFIFVDPFATELKTSEFKDMLIGQNTVVKDIMILANFNAFKRLRGRGYDTDKQKLADFLGISLEEIEKHKDNQEFFSDIFLQKFQDIKKFAIGVAIPTSNKGSIVNQDFFYLILYTSSLGVADAFLSSYEDNIKIYTQQTDNFELFSSDDYDFLPKGKTAMSLFEIIEYNFMKLFSWKGLINSSFRFIPTSKNVIGKINELYKKNKLAINCDDKYWNTNKTGLNSNKISNKEHTRDITITIPHKQH